MNHQRFDALVTDEHIRAPTQDLECDPFLPAPLQEGDQFVNLAWIGEIRCRPTESKPYEGSQGHVALHGPAEVVEYVHRPGFPVC